MINLNFGKKLNDYSIATLKLGLDLLGTILMHPLKTKRSSQLIFGFFLYAVTLIHYYFIYKQLMDINGDISVLSKTIASFSTYSQTTLKMMPAIYFRNHIVNMIYNRKFFMRIDKENQPELHEKITRLYYIGYTVSRSFFGILCLTLVTYGMKPLLIGELLVILWVPDVPYVYEIILFGQYLYALFLILVVGGMDIFYLSVCIDMTAQFRILGYNVLHLNENVRLRKTTLKKELNRCIQHHGFLVRYVQDMIRLYTVPLLGEYLITIGSSCTDLYTILDPTQPTSNRTASFTYSMSVLSQFALFCFAANMLSTEMSDMSHIYYSAGWEEFPIDLQKSIHISMMLSQREYELKGGKMVKINRETFASVWKTAFSIMTLMKSMNY